MARRLPTRNRIVELLETNGRPWELGEIASALEVEPRDHDALTRILDGMALDGVVAPRPGDRYRLASAGPERPERGDESGSGSGAPSRGESGSGSPSENRGGTGSENRGGGGRRSERERDEHGAHGGRPKKGLPPREQRRGGQSRPLERGTRRPETAVATAPHTAARNEPVRGEPARDARRGDGVTARDGSRDPRRGEERDGVLGMHPRGFGFVATPGEDVYVAPENIGGAMHGDKVRVRVRSRGPRGPEGEITELLERGIKRVAGVLRRRGKSAWLEPDDARVRGPVVLPSAMDARGPEGNSGEDGDAAIVVVTRWPELPGETPEGRLEAVLGRPGELRVEIAKTLAMAQIEELHSEAAVAEAEAYGPTVPTDLLAGREDLTHLPMPTIDPEDARDHDDAVWVERLAGGGYTAWICIADVSTYVRPGTKLDEEALKRGCSVYLPDRAIPMLPRALSSNLCSLLPDELRLCLGVEVRLDAGGRTVSSRVFRGVMKSAAKLTYGGVARALGLTAEPPKDERAEEMRDDLRIAFELSRLLRTQRMKRGALDFELPEPKVVLGPNGTVADVGRRTQDPGMKKAYQLVEELMLLANETVATWLVQRNVPAIFRVHEPPDELKLAKLAAMCEALGIDLDPEAIRDPKGLQALSKVLAEHPLALVLNMLLLRSMKQAYYDVRNLGHFGLASKAYLHFTSPIRRYPDLVVHRAVHAVLDGKKIDPDDDDARERLVEAASAASSAERRAMEVERDVVDLHRAILMRERVGERYEGTVTALVGSGVYVALDAPFVDVLVRMEDLGPDSWGLDDDGLFVVAGRSGERIGLGDRMILEIIDVSIVRRAVLGRRVRGERDGEERGERGGRGGRDDGRGRPERRTFDAKGSKKGPKGSKNRIPPKGGQGGKKGGGKSAGPGPKKGGGRKSGGKKGGGKRR